MSDPYLVLGLTSSATDAQIRSQYRKLAKRFHPDRWAMADPQSQAEAAAKMRALNAAHDAIHSQPRIPDRSRRHPRPRGTTSPREPAPTSSSDAGRDSRPTPLWTLEVAGPAPRRRCQSCGLGYHDEMLLCPFCAAPNRTLRRDVPYELTDRIGAAGLAGVLWIVVVALVWYRVRLLSLVPPSPYWLLVGPAGLLALTLGAYWFDELKDWAETSERAPRTRR